MGKKLLLIIALLLSHASFANERELGPIIQRQFKQIQELKAKVTKLENDVSLIQATLAKNSALNNTNTVKVQGGAQNSLGQKPIIGENVIDKPTPISTAENNFLENNAQQGQLLPANNDKTSYDLALASLKEGKFDSAEKQFTDFIANYPSSKLQSNALFWYAETFYRRENFNKAAINYLQCYKQFPAGIKAPDALLKLSYSLYALNKSSEACNIIGKLETEFPQRSANLVKRSEEAKIKFKCK